MSKRKIENRNINFLVREAVQTEDGKMKLSGTAIVYNIRTQLWDGFYEEIESGALAKAVSTRQQKMYWQHDRKQPMASVQNGTLSLTDTGEGIDFSAEVSGTVWGRQGYEAIKAGEVRHMSFGFTVGKDRVESEGQKKIRKIEEIKELFEVSPVSDPAYADTSVEARSIITESVQNGRAKLRARKIALEEEA